MIKTRYCTEVVDFLSAAYGNVRLRECKQREFVWELKRGFKQGGRKWSCPLARVSVKRASTVALAKPKSGAPGLGCSKPG